MSLLDCGCDDGDWTLKLGARIGVVRLYGIEIVDESRQAALQKGIIAKTGDLNEPFPFEDELFEIVHANQVIEHLKDTDHFIKEIWRTLKPGGYAVICTENLSSWHNIFSLVFGWQPFSLSNVCEKRFQIGNPLAMHYGDTPLEAAELAASPRLCISRIERIIRCSWLRHRICRGVGVLSPAERLEQARPEACRFSHIESQKGRQAEQQGLSEGQMLSAAAQRTGITALRHSGVTGPDGLENGFFTDSFCRYRRGNRALSGSSPRTDPSRVGNLTMDRDSALSDVRCHSCRKWPLPPGLRREVRCPSQAEGVVRSGLCDGHGKLSDPFLGRAGCSRGLPEASPRTFPMPISWRCWPQIT